MTVTWPGQLPSSTAHAARATATPNVATRSLMRLSRRVRARREPRNCRRGTSAPTPGASRLRPKGWSGRASRGETLSGKRNPRSAVAQRWARKDLPARELPLLNPLVHANCSNASNSLALRSPSSASRPARGVSGRVTMQVLAPCSSEPERPDRADRGTVPTLVWLRLRHLHRARLQRRLHRRAGDKLDAACSLPASHRGPLRLARAAH